MVLWNRLSAAGLDNAKPVSSKAAPYDMLGTNLKGRNKGRLATGLADGEAKPSSRLRQKRRRCDNKSRYGLLLKAIMRSLFTDRSPCIFRTTAFPTLIGAAIALCAASLLAAAPLSNCLWSRHSRTACYKRQRKWRPKANGLRLGTLPLGRTASMLARHRCRQPLPPWKLHFPTRQAFRGNAADARGPVADARKRSSTETVDMVLAPCCHQIQIRRIAPYQLQRLSQYNVRRSPYALRALST